IHRRDAEDAEVTQRLWWFSPDKGYIVLYDAAPTQNTLNYSLRNLRALCVSAVQFFVALGV
ncbi:MAG: hypothetical protein M3437_15690, partial [Chloroflexota bacterium]|nr:hypothetical protein [Chloroflexota bacterium]